MVVQNVREDEGRVLLDMLESLRTGAQGSAAITVRILAANDHDGVCAAKILVSVLHSRGVKYTVVPVTGNTEIVDNVQQLGAGDTEVRSLVLLNCGGSLDLPQLLEENGVSPDLRCFVVDSHRPFLLQNLSRRAERVFVYDDDPRHDPGHDDSFGAFARPPVDEDDEDAGAADEADDAREEPEEDAGLDDASRVEAERARAERKRKRSVDRVEREERKRQRVNEYYMATYCAMPAAVSLFKLARQAALATQDLLWAAAVSLVGYHELGLLGKVEYDRVAWDELKEAFDRADDDFSSLTGTPGATAAGGGGIFGGEGTAVDPATQGSDDESSMPPPSGRRRARGGAGGSDSRQLKFEADFRLLLYKHWTLEESMNHSGYFYGTLELHRDKGVRALKNFFATAGIAPNDYKQLYSCMSLPIRKSLHKKFGEFGKGYGLSKDRMFLQQFVLDRGPLGDAKHALWLKEISCSDAAYMVIALLSFVPSNLGGARLEALPLLESGRRDTGAILEMEKQAMKENFWRAFDTVLCEDPNALREGIAEAVEVAKAVQSMGRFVKDTNALRKSSRFQWCKIEQPPHVFRHHLSVRRLAVWLLQVFFTYRPQGEALERPLLLVVRDQVRETYLCVGCTPNHLSDEGDEFAHLFRSVLRADRSLKYRYDLFDKTAIEVAADDFDRFWELLNDSAE